MTENDFFWSNFPTKRDWGPATPSNLPMFSVQKKVMCVDPAYALRPYGEHVFVHLRDFHFSRMALQTFKLTTCQCYMRLASYTEH